MIIERLKKIKHRTRIRTRYRDFRKKLDTVIYIYRNDGLYGLSRHIEGGLKKRFAKNVNVNYAGDVLFVSINDSLLDRYRTDHMIEGLRSTGVKVGKIFYYELKAEHVKQYNTFIFYRCPWLPEFSDIFDEIRKRNKVSIYAVDDLVIDTKYTNSIPAVQRLNPEDRAIYDDGVNRHKKLMEHCDYAITTTGVLAEELKNYPNLKDIYIDRNSMSEEMLYHSSNAIKEVERDGDKIIIGYFSGTSTHNEDFQMIAPALVRLLEEDSRVYIKLAGRIDAPEALKEYEDRIIFTPYVDWRRLPYELRKSHIVLAPLVDNIFNRAKSEIKWSEAALVGVPVVASDIGAYKDSIVHNETGVLVGNDENSWYEGIKSLIVDRELYQSISSSSREYVVNHSITTGERAISLKRFLDGVTPKIVAFAGVNISAISGGNIVIKKHMDILRERGYIVYGVETMDYREGDEWQNLNIKDDESYDIFRINSRRHNDRVVLDMHFDNLVATFWSSVDFVDSYRYMKAGGRKQYLVQSMEAGFYNGVDPVKIEALATYHNHRLETVTISEWCKKWLKLEFNRVARYAPNGLDVEKFEYKERDWSGRKVKVLIEGDNSSEYKKVDESFVIANQLDSDRYEVSYMSYKAEPKDWYRVDNTYIKVSPDEVGDIYSSHDILIKSSILESFSYPPIEMMATGGVVVLARNDGNAEYIIDGKNALYYKEGDISDAVQKIESLVSDKDLYSTLSVEGRRTAEQREWSSIVERVSKLYE